MPKKPDINPNRPLAEIASGSLYVYSNVPLSAVEITLVVVPNVLDGVWVSCGLFMESFNRTVFSICEELGRSTRNSPKRISIIHRTI